jgi:hypothetical protein
MRSTLRLFLLACCCVSFPASVLAQDTATLEYPSFQEPGIAISLGVWQSNTSLESINNSIGRGLTFPDQRPLYGFAMQVFTPRSVWDMELGFSANYRKRPNPGEQIVLSESRFMIGGMYSLPMSKHFRLSAGMSIGLGSFLLKYSNDSFLMPGTGVGDFRNRSLTEYNNNAFLFVPRAQLMIFPYKYTAVSISAGYQFDPSDGFWTFHDNMRLEPGPRTNHDGLSLNVSIHAGVGMRRPTAAMLRSTKANPDLITPAF